MKLEDIAVKLNLSVSTVSRAMTGKGRVSSKTKERVIATAQEAGYTVNGVAQSLRLRDAKNVGVIVPDISNSFFAAVIKGAQQCCRENGYILTVCNSDENVIYEEEALHMLLGKQISGLILASVGGSAEQTDQYARLNIPTVYIDNIPEKRTRCDVVSIDNAAAARELTERMFQRGYNRIGMITGPLSQSSGLLRQKGFIEAHEKAGLKVRKEWIAEGEFCMESGYTQMTRLLALPDRPRAMLFGNNLIAYGAINAIREHKLTIPDDIALASFDALDYTGLMKPLIASVNQPAQEIGKRAAEIIMQHLHSELPLQTSRIVLEPTFADGDSW